MDIVAEIAGNAVTLLNGAITAMHETKRQLLMAGQSGLNQSVNLWRLNRAIANAKSAINRVNVLTHQQQSQRSSS